MATKNVARFIIWNDGYRLEMFNAGDDVDVSLDGVQPLARMLKGIIDVAQTRYPHHTIELNRAKFCEEEVGKPFLVGVVSIV